MGFCLISSSTSCLAARCSWRLFLDHHRRIISPRAGKDQRFLQGIGRPRSKPNVRGELAQTIPKIQDEGINGAERDAPFDDEVVIETRLALFA